MIIDLSAIEARANAATAGPWDWSGTCLGSELGGNRRDCIAHIDGDHNMPSDADQDFIVHAREDIPALCAEVRRLRRKLMAQSDKLASANAQAWLNDCKSLEPARLARIIRRLDRVQSDRAWALKGAYAAGVNALPIACRHAQRSLLRAKLTNRLVEVCCA